MPSSGIVEVSRSTVKPSSRAASDFNVCQLPRNAVASRAGIRAKPKGHPDRHGTDAQKPANSVIGGFPVVHLELQIHNLKSRLM